MRQSRLLYLLLALYFVYIGGNYYTNVFQIRVAHHIIVTLLMAWWLIGRIRKQQGLPPTPLNPAIYAGVGVWFVSAIFATDTRMALENIWILLLHVLLFFIIVNLIQRGYQRVVMEIVCFMAAILLLFVGIQLGAWFFGSSLIGSIGWIEVGRIPSLRNIPRLSWAMNGVSTLQAGFTAPLVIVVAGWAMTTQRRDYRIVLGVMSVLLFIALILTQSRGGLLSIIAAMGALSVIRLLQYQPLLQRIPRHLLGIGSAVVGVAVLAGFVFVTLPLARGNSDSGRLDMYRSAVKITIDNPITGVGVGEFGRVFREYRNPEIAQNKLAHAHNLYLNTLSETGLLGGAVGLWLLVSFGLAAWHNWKTTSNRGHRRRIEIVLAALAGLAVHSMVDVFSITPIVLLIITLAAYTIIPHPRSRLDMPATGKQAPAIVALILIVIYAIAFIPIDLANQAYFDSWDAATYDDALADIGTAKRFDPFLNLYDLQEAYVIGQSGTLDEAIAAYEAALQLEPTWETGLINLAMLEEANGNPDLALEYLTRAYSLNGRLIAAWFNWARIAEANALASDDEIINAYFEAIRSQAIHWLPTSEYWWETALRQNAIEMYLDEQNIEIQYRVYAVHDPTRLAELIPETPQSAAEWWVVGEDALSIEGDAQAAVVAFSNAIDLAPNFGDYYVARARANLELNPAQAEHDATVGKLIGSRFEYPNVVLAEFAETEEGALNLLANALPFRTFRAEFATVLYGRPAVLDILPAAYPPGPGGHVIQPWLDIAQARLEAGDIEGARGNYEFILSQAPYNTIAREQLADLQD